MTHRDGGSMPVTESTRMKEDLLAAAEAAVADRAAAEARARTSIARRTRWGVVGTGLAIVAALLAYVLVGRPEWVFPRAPLAEHPEVSEASMRLALVRERQRVEAFLREHGRLPGSPQEAGATLAGVQLERGPANTFLVRVPHGVEMLELRSTERLETFLGNSLQVILSRGGTR